MNSIYSSKRIRPELYIGALDLSQWFRALTRESLAMGIIPMLDIGALPASIWEDLQLMPPSAIYVRNEMEFICSHVHRVNNPGAIYAGTMHEQRRYYCELTLQHGVLLLLQVTVYNDEYPAISEHTWR